MPNQSDKCGVTLFVTALSVTYSRSTRGGAAVTKSTLLQKYFLGGPLTYVIVLFGMLSVFGLIVYNSINLSKSKFNPDELKAALYDHMLNCRVRSAIELAASHPSYLGRMLAYSANVDATQPETLGRERWKMRWQIFFNEGRKQMLWINLISLLAQAAR